MRFARSLTFAVMVCASAALPLAQGAASEGDTPSYKFRKALVNGKGVKSLADLQGKPVLVEFWGTR